MSKRWKSRFRKLAAKISKHLSKRILIAIGTAIILVTVTSLGVSYAAEGAIHLQLRGNHTVPVDQPLNLQFDQNVLTNKARVTITPDVPLDITWHKSGIGKTVLQVKSRQPLRTSQQYTLAIQGLQRMFSRRSIPVQTVTIRTELAPGITEFSPSAPFATRDVHFSLKATDATTARRHYELRLEPAAELHATFDHNLSWQWRPVQPLKQGTKYKVILSADGTIIQQSELQIAGQPNIVAATEKNYFYPSDTITVSFDRAMRTNQDQALFFNLPGSGKWENDKTYIFHPSGLDPNRSYTYNLKAGLASQEGGVLEADRQFIIHTPGPTAVVGAAPYGSGVSRQTTIRITFDQPVDHASAQAHFRIAPGVAGSFRWEGNTMTYAPSGLDFQSTYQATIEPGVVSAYGVPGTTTFSLQFTTEVQTIRLNVPAFSQSHKLSCEASALRMALAYRGIQTSDFDLVQRMGYNPRPQTNGEWDNPYNQFVGDIEGKQWNYTGYGVYAPPVAKAAQSLGRNASSHFGVSAGFIAQQIHSGNPVIVWGYNYTPTGFSWHTPGGQTIEAWQGEHTRTVIGVVGRADSPQGFYVTDPASGSTRYWSTGALMANMNVHGGLSNQAVVVY